MKTNLCILFGGKSEEHIVSIMSCKSVVSNIYMNKYNLFLIGIDKQGRYHEFDVQEFARLRADEIEDRMSKDKALENWEFVKFLDRNIEVVFPVLHGPNGEDGKIQGLLETLNLDYVGADVTSSALCMDKGYSKDILKNHGYPMSDYIVVRNCDVLSDEELVLRSIDSRIGYPCFIKPSNLGSSVGISKAVNKQELKKAMRLAAKFDERIIVEKGVNCRELECGVLGNMNPKTSCVGEIVASHEFYDFESKYFDEGKSKMIIPADISEGVSQEIKKLSEEAYKILNLKGLARIDFFLDKDTGKVLLNEINTIPGFTDFSMYSLLWKESGIGYSDLIDELIDLAKSSRR